jgi:hypothetical protein
MAKQALKRNGMMEWWNNGKVGKIDIHGKMKKEFSKILL